MKTQNRLTTHIALAVAATLATAPGATVAYWNFNSLSITSASAPGSGGVPTNISADSGAGTVDLNPWTGNVDDFGGSATNTLGGDPAGNSLSLIAGSGTVGNGGSILIAVSMTGRSNPTLSFATQGTGTGFVSNQLAWSVTGTNPTDFTDFGAPYAPAASYGLQSFDLSSVDALDGASSAWLRLTFDGASGSTGNNRIDNILLDAVPEPTVTSLLGCAGLVLLIRRRL